METSSNEKSWAFLCSFRKRTQINPKPHRKIFVQEDSIRRWSRNATPYPFPFHSTFLKNVRLIALWQARKVPEKIKEFLSKVLLIRGLDPRLTAFWKEHNNRFSPVLQLMNWYWNLSVWFSEFQNEYSGVTF